MTWVVKAWKPDAFAARLAALEELGSELREEVRSRRRASEPEITVRKGRATNWKGGRKQTTVWQAASPIMAFGAGGDDLATAHPTQKPLELFERAILNHTLPAEIIYDPFAGSGTALVAAERIGRRCLAIELDPGWCDVIRARYEQFVASVKGGS